MTRFSPLLVLSLVALPLAASTAQKPTTIRTIYVAPMSHLDIGFTAPPSVVASQMQAAVQQALDYARADPDYVWNVETFWQLEQWLNSNPPASDVADLVHLARNGRIGIGAAYANPHSAMMSAWALNWLFRLPTRWGAEHGLRLTAAILNDVPGHPGDLPRFLAANGVRYLVVGSNLSFSPPLPKEIASTPFWWRAPSGERVLTWISDRSYTEAFTYLGFDPDTARLFAPDRFRDADPMRVMEQGIAETIQRYDRCGYPYDSILALHAFDNWGAGVSGKLPRFAKMWNDAHDSPKIVLCTPDAFFRHIEAKYGRQLPVYSGGFGGQWETNRASVPTSMRVARRAEALLRRERRPDLKQIRNLLVFYEHSFGMGPPWPGHMTRDEALQANREQANLVAELARLTPKAKPEVLPPAAQPLPRDATAGSILRTNHLYCTSANPMFVAPGAGDLKPLTDALVGAWEELLPGGGVRLWYRVDRQRLPDSAHVVWLRELTGHDGAATVENRTATGWEAFPGGQLAGYTWGGWVCPFGFRLGRWRYHGDGIWAFRKATIEGRTWLMGLCLGQGLSATFRGGERGKLIFAEAYPGEDPVVDVSITLRSSLH